MAGVDVGVFNFPAAQPVYQRMRQRWRHLQLQHTTQLPIYVEHLSLSADVIYHRVLITDCEFTQTGMTGVFGSYSNDVRVTRSTFSDIGFIGVQGCNSINI